MSTDASAFDDGMPRDGLLAAPLDDVLAQVMALAMTLTATPAAVVAFAAPDGVLIRAASGSALDQPAAAPFADAVLAGAPAVFECDGGPAPGLRHHASVPIRLDGEVLGALCVAAAQPLQLSPTLAAALERLGDVLSAQLARERDAMRELEQARSVARYEARRFVDLADSMPVFVWTATPEGVVDYFGEPLVTYSGVPREQLEAPGWWIQLVHPDDREPTVEAWSQSVRSGEPYSTAFRLRGREGAYRWFWVSALPVRGEDGQIAIWYGCAADIDDERRLQAETRELAERLTATFASIRDAFFTLDVDGRVSGINDEARRVFAQGREVVGEPAWQAMEGLGQSRVSLECWIAFEHQRTVRFECHVEASGRWYDVSIFPARSGLTVLLRDIDARMRDDLVRAAEARVLGMMASDAELSGILEHIVLGVEAAQPGMTGSILLYDAEGGRLLHGAAPGLPEAYNRAVDGQPVGPLAGSCGTAAWSGQPVIAADIATDPHWQDYRELALRHGLKACWSTPVTGPGGEVMATFAMYYRECRSPTGQDIAITQRTAHLAAIAISRDRQQRALRASEERFRGMFRDSATGMVITSLDGRFLEANDAYCGMLGYSFEELREHDFLSLTHEDDRLRNQELFAAMLDGRRRSFVIEKRYLTKQGRIVWARVSATMQREDGRPKQLLAVAEDVTVRRHVEDAMQQQSTLLAMASRLGRLGAWVVEAPGKLLWSDEVRHMLEAPPGYEPSLQHDVATLYPPADSKAVAGAVARCLEHGTPIDLQADIDTLRGQRLRVHILGEAVRDADGRILRVQGALQDITEHHHLVQSMADSEARFREIAENIRDVFWVRTPDGGIIYVSPAYEDIWGRPLAELFERPAAWIESIHPDDRARVVAGAASVSAQRATEYRILRPDGSERWIVDTGFPVYGPKGEVVRMTGVARDITARKRAEEELRRALEQLARSNRELEDFAYVASHDLQEPLRKIRIFSGRLVDGTHALDGQQRDYLERMAAAADRMQNLILDLLDYSRITTRSQPLRPVALEVLLDEVLEDLDAAVTEAGGRIEREPLPEVIGDARQLRQLLQNLIGNALKFRRPGVAPVVRVHACHSEAGPCICVADNGVGIDAAHMERIFRPFQRLHGRDEYPGSGIGLAIVSKIAERHGARIDVRSTPGLGTEFRVIFPASSDGGPA